MKESANNMNAQSPVSLRDPITKAPSKPSGVKRLFRSVLRFLFRIVFYPLCGIKSSDNQKIV